MQGIDYGAIADTIERELNLEAQALEIDIPIELGTEQYFNARYSDPTANCDDVIYGCLTFGTTTPNGHVYQLGIAGTFISTPGTCEIVKTLLDNFARAHTPKASTDGVITLEVWQTPYVSQNFLPVGNSYRSLIRLQGTLILTEDDVDGNLEVYHVKDDGTEDEVFYLSVSLGIASTTDTQVYYGTPTSQSLVKATSRTLSLSTYLLKTDLIEGIFSAGLTPDGDGLRQSVKLRLKTDVFDTTLTLVPVSINLGKNIGNLSSVQIDFAEGGIDG